jgi:hypothetical protein
MPDICQGQLDMTGNPVTKYWEHLLQSDLDKIKNYVEKEKLKIQTQ